MKKGLVYIADFSLPNMSAYALHVLKMCDAFSEQKYSVKLILPHKKKSYTFNTIKNEFLLKRKFEIISIFNEKKIFFFLTRFFFTFKIINFLKEEKIRNIYSRSIVPAVILSFLNYNVTLEIHTEMNGFTKIFFKICNLKTIRKNLKIVVINKKLIELLNIRNKEILILDDAVDSRDFKKSKVKVLKNTCFYSGSFVKGKGIEIIKQLAQELPEFNFHLYGNVKTYINYESVKFPKNMIFKGYLTYDKLIKKINLYKILLMPYQKKISVLMKNTNVESYFSPLKMFDYMAAGKIIIASDLKVYKHILKNRINSILINPNKIHLWVKSIKRASNSNSLNYLGKNAIKNVLDYQWISRVKKIQKFYEKG
tara:strand:+ start:878 stop:1978 length:1101 start_codon:yes stop_codon:yes gene_type:complete